MKIEIILIKASNTRLLGNLSIMFCNETTGTFNAGNAGVSTSLPVESTVKVEMDLNNILAVGADGIAKRCTAHEDKPAISSGDAVSIARDINGEFVAKSPVNIGSIDLSKYKRECDNYQPFEKCGPFLPNETMYHCKSKLHCYTLDISQRVIILSEASGINNNQPIVLLFTMFNKPLSVEQIRDLIMIVERFLEGKSILIYKVLNYISNGIGYDSSDLSDCYKTVSRNVRSAYGRDKYGYIVKSIEPIMFNQLIGLFDNIYQNVYSFEKRELETTYGTGVIHIINNRFIIRYNIDSTSYETLTSFIDLRLELPQYMMDSYKLSFLLFDDIEGTILVNNGIPDYTLLNYVSAVKSNMISRCAIKGPILLASGTVSNSMISNNINKKDVIIKTAKDTLNQLIANHESLLNMYPDLASIGLYQITNNSLTRLLNSIQDVNIDQILQSFAFEIELLEKSTIKYRKYSEALFENAGDSLLNMNAYRKYTSAICDKYILQLTNAIYTLNLNTTMVSKDRENMNNIMIKKIRLLGYCRESVMKTIKSLRDSKNTIYNMDIDNK